MISNFDDKEPEQLLQSKLDLDECEEKLPVT